MNTDLYRWPLPIKLYPDRNNKSYRMKRFRFHLRSLLNYSQIKQFEKFVHQHNYLNPLLNERANWSYPVAHRFLDKRFNAKKRRQLVQDNLTFLPQKLVSLGLPMLWDEPINMGEITENFELWLKVNEYQPMEGYWALELRQKEPNRLIYLATFAKVDDALLIAVIQGPNYEDSKEIVKRLTKQCYGLRPAYLMVEAMKALTITLGYSRLLGIPHKYQNKSRIVQSKRYVVNYDAIFGESGGKLSDYWELPLQFETKDIRQIESKKRSMYRNRYALLGELLTKMKNKLNC